MVNWGLVIGEPQVHVHAHAIDCAHTDVISISHYDSNHHEVRMGNARPWQHMICWMSVESPAFDTKSKGLLKTFKRWVKEMETLYEPASTCCPMRQPLTNGLRCLLTLDLSPLLCAVIQTLRHYPLLCACTASRRSSTSRPRPHFDLLPVHCPSPRFSRHRTLQSCFRPWSSRCDYGFCTQP